MSNIKLLLSSVFIVILAFSCQEDPVSNQEHTPTLPSEPYNYMSVMDEVADFTLPQTMTVGNNEIITNANSEHVLGGAQAIDLSLESDDIVTLGRVLFYDNRMSANNSIACASCHQQNKGFADSFAKSEGFGGQKTSRNSMSIANPIAKRNFFWDGRAGSLSQLALEPVFNHIEMGIESESDLLEKLRAEDYYADLFQKAYGSPNISSSGVQKALSHFVGSIFKRDSEFDEGLENGFADMTELEKHGMALFFSAETNCSSCHNGVNFASPTNSFNNPYVSTAGTTNIGLDQVYEDKGFSRGKFSIPSLRNIALTAPYMHDGRFETLREVLDHYNDGIKNHTDLDSKLMRNGAPLKMELTDLDLDAMEAFLRTLTSKTLTTDAKYSNPFKS